MWLLTRRGVSLGLWGLIGSAMGLLGRTEILIAGVAYGRRNRRYVLVSAEI